MNTGGAMAHIPPAPRFLQKKHRACCRNGRKKLHLHTNGQTKHTMATNTTYRTDPAHAVQAQIRCALLTFAPPPLKFHNTYQLPSNLPATAGRRRMTQHGRTARLRISDNRPRLPEGVRNGADNRPRLTEGVGYGMARTIVCNSPKGYGTARTIVRNSPKGYGMARTIVCNSPKGYGMARTIVCNSPKGYGTARTIVRKDRELWQTSK